MRFQKRTGTPRIPRSASFIARANRQIEQTAARFNVSKSFVIAVAVEYALGISETNQATPKPQAVAPLRFRARKSA